MSSTSTLSKIQYKNHHHAPSSVSAWELFQEEIEQLKTRKTTFLLEPSPEAMRDVDNKEWLGLYPGVTELAGPAGSGKTQIALNLCLSQARHAENEERRRANLSATRSSSATAEISQRIRKNPYHRTSTQTSACSGNKSDDKHEENTTTPRHSAVYLSLGGTLKWNKIVQRLNQMAGGNHKLLQRVATRTVLNEDDWLHDVLDVQLPELLERNKGSIRVVVVDALADLFRATAMANNDRAAQLCRVAQHLKQMADRHEVSVLVLNQVTGNNEHPALGLAWAHCCNASFGTQIKEASCYGHRTDENNPQRNQLSLTGQRRRILVLRHSSRYQAGGHNCLEFAIDTCGIRVVAIECRDPLIIKQPGQF